ncbi:MAG TPA: 50S ribosomal protein L11 methyltransferase [Lichenihabitans sp.]|jgi:predicted nicotinamide N-methyase|nr:50S ribosomal protein L11 methyltransferase [Lichenihabitans sp.]
MTGRAPSSESIRRFIRSHLPIAPVPSVPEIRLHQARPTSGLRRLARRDPQGFDRPYWAYAWAGGVALARHVLDHPGTVAARRVLDLGAGSGVVGIAAAKAGARQVSAADTDRYAVAALGLNAVANDVAVTSIEIDIDAGPPAGIDLVLVGDLFYDEVVAERVTAFLDRCATSAIDVLIGDPGRAFLPHAQLRRLADYPVPDVGGASNAADGRSAVFAFEPALSRQ